MDGAELFPSLPLGVLLLSSILAYLIIDSLLAQRIAQANSKCPLVGSPVGFMPLFVHNVLYLFRAATHAQTGYKMVSSLGTSPSSNSLISPSLPAPPRLAYYAVLTYFQFKNRAFQLLRYEGSVVVLPHTLLEELVLLPETIASGQAALSIDLAGPFTGLDLIVENRLQNIIIQRRLTPKLPLLIPRLEQSANDAFDAHFPEQGAEWTEVKPFSLLKHVSASLAADILVGSNLRDDPAWLDLSAKFTEDGK